MVKTSSCWSSRYFSVPGVFWWVESCILPSPQCTLLLIDREALSSTMQTTACSRSDQHLPVAALPEHMDKVVVFLGRGSLSKAMRGGKKR